MTNPTTEMRALDYTPGLLDETAPPRIWLQVDTSGSRDCRDEPFPTDLDGVTWQDEEIGGLEVEYVRADLAAWNTRALQAEPGEEVVEAARYRWLRERAEAVIDWDFMPDCGPDCLPLEVGASATLDAAIDAAMLTSPDSGKEG